MKVGGSTMPLTWLNVSLNRDYLSVGLDLSVPRPQSSLDLSSKGAHGLGRISDPSELPSNLQRDEHSRCLSLRNEHRTPPPSKSYVGIMYPKKSPRDR